VKILLSWVVVVVVVVQQMVLLWYVCVYVGRWVVVAEKLREQRVKCAQCLLTSLASGRQASNRGVTSLSTCRANNTTSLLLIVLSLTSNTDLIVSTATTSRQFASCSPIPRHYHES
jgi:hypothetical protein